VAFITEAGVLSGRVVRPTAVRARRVIRAVSSHDRGARSRLAKPGTDPATHPTRALAYTSLTVRTEDIPDTRFMQSEDIPDSGKHALEGNGFDEGASEFILEWEKRWDEGEGRLNFAALCREFGISRQVGTCGLSDIGRLRGSLRR